MQIAAATSSSAASPSQPSDPVQRPVSVKRLFNLLPLSSSADDRELSHPDDENYKFFTGCNRKLLSAKFERQESDIADSKSCTECVVGLVGLQALRNQQEMNDGRAINRREHALQCGRIPAQFIEDRLLWKHRQRAILCDLILYVPFLLMFLFFFLLRQTQEESFWAAQQLRDGSALEQGMGYKSSVWGNENPSSTTGAAYHKGSNPYKTPGLRPGEFDAYVVKTTFLDIRQAEDWHAWLESVFVPYFWNGNRSARFLEGGAIPVGGIQIRAIRVNAEDVKSCKYTRFYSTQAKIARPNPGVGAGGCYPDIGDGTVNSSDITISWSASNGTSEQQQSIVFPFQSCSWKGPKYLGERGTYDCSGNVFSIPFNVTSSEAVARAQFLRHLFFRFGHAGGLFNLLSTRLLVAETMVYFSSLDQFFQIKAVLEISSSGEIRTDFRVFPFEVWKFDSPYYRGVTGYMAAFYLLVVLYVGKLLYGLYSSARRDQGTFYSYIFNAWHFVDFVNLLMFFAVFVLRLMWIAYCRDHAVSLLFRDPPLSTNAALMAQNPVFTDQGYITDLDIIAWLYYLQVCSNAVNTVLCFMKILRFAELSPSLRVVVDTVQYAQQNILGILVIFFIVLTGYTLAGVLLFSHAIEDYLSFERTTSSLLRLLLGDFEYESMREVNPFLAGVFFWSFVILGMYLLLNFFVGALSGSLKERMKKVQTTDLSDRVIGVFRRLKYLYDAFCAAETLEEFLRSNNPYTYFYTTRRKFAELQEALWDYRCVDMPLHKTSFASVFNDLLVVEQRELVSRRPMSRDDLHFAWRKWRPQKYRSDPRPQRLKQHESATTVEESATSVESHEPTHVASSSREPSTQIAIPQEWKDPKEALSTDEEEFLDSQWVRMYEKYLTVQHNEEQVKTKALATELKFVAECALRWCFGLRDDKGDTSTFQSDAFIKCADARKAFVPIYATYEKLRAFDKELSVLETTTMELAKALGLPERSAEGAPGEEGAPREEGAPGGGIVASASGVVTRESTSSATGENGTFVEGIQTSASGQIGTPGQQEEEL